MKVNKEDMKLTHESVRGSLLKTCQNAFYTPNGGRSSKKDSSKDPLDEDPLTRRDCRIDFRQRILRPSCFS